MEQAVSMMVITVVRVFILYFFVDPLFTRPARLRLEAFDEGPFHDLDFERIKVQLVC